MVVKRQEDELEQAEAIVDRVEQTQIYLDKGREKGSLNGSCYYAEGNGESAYCVEKT